MNRLSRPQSEHIHQLSPAELFLFLFTNLSALPAHVQRVAGKRADDAAGMRVFLGANSGIFPPIFCV